MKKLLLSAIAIAVLFIIGCGGATVFDGPEITKVVMDATSVTVTWAADTTVENDGDFSGYNVYVATDSTELLVEDGEDLNKDNATVITGNSYTIDGLSQDTVYYIQVRTVNVDDEVGSYNATTPFVEASPRPEFTVTVKLERNNSAPDDSCAIKFSDGTIMADSAMANGGADMWVDFWGTAPDDTTAFSSPDHHSTYGTNSRNTDFVNLGQYDFDDVSEVTSEPSANYVAVIEGDLVVAKTQDGNYVKIHVDALDDTLNYTVTITYAYQNIANYPHFSE